MCDYCDCRSRAPLAAFAVEHERVGDLLRRVERSWERDDGVAEAVARAELVALLERHSSAEERGLYRELAAMDIDVSGLGDEHERIHAGLRSPERREVATAIAALRDHIRAEEYDLFPASHQLLDDAAWDRLTDEQ